MSEAGDPDGDDLPRAAGDGVTPPPASPASTPGARPTGRRGHCGYPEAQPTLRGPANLSNMRRVAQIRKPRKMTKDPDVILGLGGGGGVSGEAREGCWLVGREGR